MDFLTKGTLVEIVGTPFAKGYIQDDQSVKTEIRLNVSKTNILRPGASAGTGGDYEEDENDYNSQDEIDDLENDLF